MASIDGVAHDRAFAFFRGTCTRGIYVNMKTEVEYVLKRWPAFTRFLGDGRICLSNNAAERALKGVAVGRRS